MSSHRYWRAVDVRPHAGSSLEISELSLCDEATVVSSTLTANIAPDSGSLAALYDGNTGSVVGWDRAYGLTFHWDLGSATEVNNVQVGGGNSNAKFPLNLRLEWSDDDVSWSMQKAFAGIVWPGVRTLTSNANQREYCPHWRIMITANNGGALTAIQEIELRGLAGGTDLTTATMVTGESSFYAPDNARGYKAFDNNYITFVDAAWVSANGSLPQWVSVNLGYDVAIAEILIAPQRYSGGADRAPKDFSLQSSIDGVVWETVASFTNVVGWVFTDPQIFTIPLPSTLTIQRGLVRGTAQTRRIAPIYVGGENADPSGVRYEPPLRALRNFLVDRDTGTVTGTVKEKNTPDNTPLRRRVRLYRERDGMLLQETWSDAVTGAYAFNRVDSAEKYTVLAYDHQHNYRAVAADNLVPT